MTRAASTRDDGVAASRSSAESGTAGPTTSIGAKRGFYLLLAGVGLLYVLTLRPGQPWDDDFALYILHARNLITGRPYAETGFLYNPTDPLYSPRVYPPGFPLLLAPIYGIFGADLFALRLVVVASVAGLVAVVAAIGRTWLSPRAALAAAALVGFQPFFMRFKDLLLPDFTFATLALLSLYLIHLLHTRERTDRKTLGLAVLAGVCLYLAIAQRTVGITLFGGIAAYHVLRLRLPGAPVLLAVSLAGLLYWAQSALMPPASGYAAQFTDIVSASGSMPTVRFRRVVNLVVSSDVLWAGSGELRAPPVEGVARAHLIFMTLGALGLALIGFAVRLRRLSVFETFGLAYCGALIVWGTTSARYLLPVAPLMMLYLVTGLGVAARLGRVGRLAAVSFTLLVGGTYAFHLARFDRTGFDGGVTAPFALEAFEHIRACTAPDARLLARRPRAFALYTGRASTSLGGRHAEDADLLARFLETEHIDHLVAFRGSRLDASAAALPVLERTFDNGRILVYSRRIGGIDGQALRCDPTN